MIKHFGNVRHKFQNWVKSRMRPLTVEEAEEKRQFWSKCYMWSMVSLFVFMSVRTIYMSRRKEEQYDTDYLPVNKSLLNKYDDKQEVKVYRVGWGSVDKYKYSKDRKKIDWDENDKQNDGDWENSESDIEF